MQELKVSKAKGLVPTYEEKKPMAHYIQLGIILIKYKELRKIQTQILAQ